jgi:hypothetical protein
MAAAVLMAGVGLGSVVSGAAASSAAGYDISYPQCNGAFPTSPAFGIVGVNDGKPYSVNPCLGTGDGPSELQWAGVNAGLYVNTANPGPALSTHWPNGQASPEQCNTTTNPGSDTAACAYDYGWNAAADSYQDAVNAYISLGWAQAGATRTPVANAWWLDVESANSWTSNTAFNVDALQGEADYLNSVGAASVGFYANSSDWLTITGNTTSFAGYQSWIPGASTLSQAQANCAGGGITGGGVALTQYPSGGFDGDYQCGVATPSLTFSTASQNLTAGGSSGPMTVSIPRASNSATTVTLSSSSGAGAFASAAGGPWSASLTVSVPAGSTSTSSFYYTDTHAGQPLLTASASGYTNATQSESVTAGALAAVAVKPSSAQVRVGAHVSFSAAGQDRYGNPVPVSPTWSVSPTLGSFSPNPGNPVTFTGRSAGSGTVTASIGSVNGTASIAVTSKKVSQQAARSSVAAPKLTMLVRLPSTVTCVRGGHLRVLGRRHAPAELRSLTVWVNGRLAARVSMRALRAGAELRLPAGLRYQLALKAITRSGRRISARYVYRACDGSTPTMLPARPGG